MLDLQKITQAEVERAGYKGPLISKGKLLFIFVALVLVGVICILMANSIIFSVKM
jgi:hypothetical protein